MNKVELFNKTREVFELPENVIYLDGNSLGPMTRFSRERLQDEMENQWSKKLIRGWNESGWYHLSQTVGNKIAQLIGAPPGTVTATDSTSLNLHKALSAALSMNPQRRKILSDSGNFPTDLYVAQGVIAGLEDDYELVIVEPEQIVDSLDEEVAVLLITQVDYCTGRLHDMAEITQQAHNKGVKTVWDLCHSAGALPLQLEALSVDFAVGCGYKYLNGGPGAPAFIYIREDYIEQVEPVLTGWMGHEAPFVFEPQYRPVKSIERMRVGTPSVLALASLDAALEVWQGVDMSEVRDQSITLSELFIKEVSLLCPTLELASPTDPQQRGSQVSFRYQEGYAVVQALIEEGVIGDFRMPDIMRFGITPLYLSEQDIRIAAQKLAKVLKEELWNNEKFLQKNAVT